MQSMSYDVRKLYRYSPNGLIEPNRGGAARTWRRSTRFYRLSFYPRESMRMQEEFGINDDVLWFAMVNDTEDFKLGDRIGDATEQLYEVVKIRTYRGSQQMEVKEIARSNSRSG